jgi:hypothetical protein
VRRVKGWECESRMDYANRVEREEWGRGFCLGGMLWYAFWLAPGDIINFRDGEKHSRRKEDDVEIFTFAFMFWVLIFLFMVTSECVRIITVSA